MWIENGHKMPKKGPNKLKFGPNMYFYVFYRIPNDYVGAEGGRRGVGRRLSDKLIFLLSAISQHIWTKINSFFYLDFI